MCNRKSGIEGRESGYVVGEGGREGKIGESAWDGESNEDRRERTVIEERWRGRKREL